MPNQLFDYGISQSWYFERLIKSMLFGWNQIHPLTYFFNRMNFSIFDECSPINIRVSVSQEFTWNLLLLLFSENVQ